MTEWGVRLKDGGEVPAAHGRLHDRHDGQPAADRGRAADGRAAGSRPTPDLRVAGPRQRLGPGRLRRRAERLRRQAVAADGPVRGAAGEAAGRQPGRGRRRPADASRSRFKPLGQLASIGNRRAVGQVFGSAVVGLPGVVPVAGHLPEQDADAGPQGADRLRLGLATVLPARHRAAEPVADRAAAARPTTRPGSRSSTRATRATSFTSSRRARRAFTSTRPGRRWRCSATATISAKGLLLTGAARIGVDPGGGAAGRAGDRPGLVLAADAPLCRLAGGDGGHLEEAGRQSHPAAEPTAGVAAAGRRTVSWAGPGQEGRRWRSRRGGSGCEAAGNHQPPPADRPLFEFDDRGSRRRSVALGRLVAAGGIEAGCGSASSRRQRRCRAC